MLFYRGRFYYFFFDAYMILHDHTWSMYMYRAEPTRWIKGGQTKKVVRRFLFGVGSLQNGPINVCQKNILTRSSQNLLRPGEGWAQPFCRAFELHCHL